MAITIDGVTYRNLPEQVKENAENIEQLQADVVELQEGAKLKYEVVDELPETGESGIVYLVPMDDGEQPNIYEEYLWVDGEWEMIGTTAIDLTNYVTLDGTQTISGVKTFSNGIKIGTDATATPNSWGTVVYANAVTGLYTFDTILETQTLRPTSSGEYDLGIATRLWKDLHLSGSPIIYGTNEKAKITFDDWGIYFKRTYDGGNTYADCFYASTSEMYTRSVVPMGTSNYNLGSTSKWWNDEYISGKILFKDKSGGNSRLWRLGNTQYGTLNIEYSTDNGSTWVSRYGFQVGSFIPTVGDTVDLGFNSVNQRWHTLYLSNSVDLPNSTISENNDTSLVLSNSNGEVVFNNCVLSDGTNTVSIADLKALIDYAKGQGWIS